MYEVELGKLAETKAMAQDIKDQGNTEAHDHKLVGDKLKSIVEANGMEFPKQLNAEFQTRLDNIGALPANTFDAAYIEDMKKIHAADGRGLFSADLCAEFTKMALDYAVGFRCECTLVGFLRFPRVRDIDHLEPLLPLLTSV